MKDASADALGRAQCLSRIANGLLALTRYHHGLRATELSREAADAAARTPGRDISREWWRPPQVIKSLTDMTAALALLNLERLEEARHSAEQARLHAQDDPELRSLALEALLTVQFSEGDWTGSAETLELIRKIDVDRGTGELEALWYEVLNMSILACQGHGDEVLRNAQATWERFERFGDTEHIASLAEALSIALGADRPDDAAEPRGAALAYRDRQLLPVDNLTERLLERDAKVRRAAIGAYVWDVKVEQGRSLNLLYLLNRLCAAPTERERG